MALYKVVYRYVQYDEDYIEANTADDAEAKWEDRCIDELTRFDGCDAELVSIENESTGEQVFY